MAISVLTAFWAVSLLFVITPGADWAYAISAGMRGRWVMPAVAGMLSGHFLATLVVAAGVGSLLAGHPLALMLLTLAGCTYLLWLGGNLLLSPALPAAGQGALVVAVLAVAGWFLLPRIFAQAARAKDPELFLAASLLVVIVAALGCTECGPEGQAADAAHSIDANAHGVLRHVPNRFIQDIWPLALACCSTTPLPVHRGPGFRRNSP